MTRNLGVSLVVLGLLGGCHKPVPPSPPAQEAPKTEPAKTPPRPQDGRTAEEQAEFLLDMADVHLKHKSYLEAMKHFLEAQGLTKNADLLGRATYGVALVHIARGDLKLAVGPLNSAIATAASPNRAELQFLLCAVQVDLNDLSAAEAVLDRMLEEPDASIALRNRIYQQILDLYEKKKDIPALAAKLEKRSAANPKDRDGLFVLGQLYAARLNDPVRALGVFEKLAPLAPEDVTVLQALMETQVRADKADAAGETAEKILKLVEKEPAAQARVLKYLGDLWVEKKSWDRAVVALERAEKLATTPAQKDEVRIAFYGALKEAGKLPAKVEELDKAVAADAKDETSLRGLLLIHQRFTKATARAEEVLEKLLGLRADDPVYLAAGIDIARQKGDHEKLADRFERLLAADARAATELVDEYLNALDFLGRLERGMDRLTKLAESDRANRVAVLSRAAAALASKKDEAVKLWKRMLEAIRESRQPSDYAIGVSALRRAGFAQDAWELAQEALRLKMDAAAQGAIQLECVDILAAQGKAAEAEKLCGEIAARPDVPEQARQAARRKLEEIQKSRK